jgi:hypothetical protein
MNWIQKILGQNYKTTVGGAMVGIPPIVYSAFLAASITPSKWYTFTATLCMGLGGLILGTNAKDSTTHSTQAEVSNSTVQQPWKPFSK